MKASGLSSSAKKRAKSEPSQSARAGEVLRGVSRPEGPSSGAAGAEPPPGEQSEPLIPAPEGGELEWWPWERWRLESGEL